MLLIVSVVVQFGTHLIVFRGYSTSVLREYASGCSRIQKQSHQSNLGHHEQDKPSPSYYLSGTYPIFVFILKEESGVTLMIGWSKR